MLLFWQELTKFIIRILVGEFIWVGLLQIKWISSKFFSIFCKTKYFKPVLPVGLEFVIIFCRLQKFTMWVLIVCSHDQWEGAVVGWKLLGRLDPSECWYPHGQLQALLIPVYFCWCRNHFSLLEEKVGSFLWGIWTLGHFFGLLHSCAIRPLETLVKGLSFSIDNGHVSFVSVG